MTMAFALGVALATVIVATSAVAESRSPPIGAVKNIVLVHGAITDGSGWRGVHDILIKNGYRVSVVQQPLTGLVDDVAATKLGRQYLADALLWNGELEAARREIELEPIGSLRLSRIAQIERARHNQGAVDAALQKLLSATDGDKDYSIGAVYADRHDVDAAIIWLEHARTAHYRAFGEINSDPTFGALRNAPAFGTYLHGFKFPD